VSSFFKTRFLPVPFPPFFPGSGLGLSIARSIAKAHQGQITVQSRPGKGATFIVGFPIADA